MTAFAGIETLPELKSVEVGVHGRALFFFTLWITFRADLRQRDLWKILPGLMADEANEYLKERFRKAGREGVVVRIDEKV